ncbi:DNA mismatch repair protein MutS [Alicyclobacillus fodiniaquatilis]|uniref:DNA mismatch repair protein MutS n=1 Tax=Alicyclobacillus fodiniaquatilis TaxID=1661150 RepID=A0ABW4JE23_9BACL
MGLTPMMRQYQEIKATHQDALLMFRLGDFYEMFFEDAVVASRELDITLTGRDAGDAGRIPMCGVPHHAVEQYLERLTDKGFRVAICDQVEDPKATKGLVRREVVRIVTPGTALSDEHSNRFLATIVAKGASFGMAMVDVGTGEVYVGQADETLCREQLWLWRPLEIVVAKQWEMPDWLTSFTADTDALMTFRAAADEALIQTQYEVASPVVFGLAAQSPAAAALANLLQYIQETQKMTLRHLQEPKNLFVQAHLQLNQAALHHLELLQTAREGSRKGSLLELLDETMTSAGGRLLRTWLERPLCQRDAIDARHEAVELFVRDLFLREEIRDGLRGVHDLSRLVARIAFNRGNARDLLALANSLTYGQAVIDALRSTTDLPRLIAKTVSDLPGLTDLIKTIQAQLVDEPPVSTHEGRMFREGVDESLDRLRTLQLSGRTWLRDLEQQERERTGIKSLKVGYNKVFGYYIEISKANLGSIPANYERRQTLSNAERFILPELKAREAEILSAEDRAMAKELEMFQALCERVLGQRVEIQAWADALAQMDVLQSLAHVAVMQNYVRPEMRDEVGIDIEQGRHPVVEKLSINRFVPNDTRLCGEQQMILLTGPNMGGKSTYMRQTAIIVIMAQMGAFVPAKRAVIGVVDQIFARIGAADDLGRGQSTFMVEMIELAEILRQSTARTLVLLDEIGRGTSTYDGLSIAEAVVEEMAQRSDCPLTMFATHYHELIAFSQSFANVCNYSMAVEETDAGVTFLHTVVERPSDRSYGIQVARLAGLPPHVIARATALLAVREGMSSFEVEAAAAKQGSPAIANNQTTAQDETALGLFQGPYVAFVEQLAACDVLRMTPLDAMNHLHQITEKAKELIQWEKSN